MPTLRLPSGAHAPRSLSPRPEARSPAAPSPKAQDRDVLEVTRAKPEQTPAVRALVARFACDASGEPISRGFVERLMAMTPAELALVPEQLEALAGFEPSVQLLDALASVKEPWEPVVRNAVALRAAIPGLDESARTLVKVSQGRTPRERAAFTRACIALCAGMPENLTAGSLIKGLHRLPEAAWQPTIAAVQRISTWHVPAYCGNWVEKMSDPATRASLPEFDPGTVADALSVGFMRRFLLAAPFPGVDKESVQWNRTEALCCSLRHRMEREGTSAEVALALLEAAWAAKLAPLPQLLGLLPATLWTEPQPLERAEAIESREPPAAPWLQRFFAVLQDLSAHERRLFDLDAVAPVQHCIETAPVPMALQLLEGLSARGFRSGSSLNRLLAAIVAEPEPLPALQRLLAIIVQSAAPHRANDHTGLRRAVDYFHLHHRVVDPAACAALGTLIQAPVGDSRTALASRLGALFSQEPDEPLVQKAPQLSGRALVKELVLNAAGAEGQPRARASLEHRLYRDNVALRRAVAAVVSLAESSREYARAALSWPQPAQLRALLQEDLAEAAGDPARVAQLQTVLRAQSEFAARSTGDFVLENRAYLREVRAYLATRVMPLQLERLELTAALLRACPALAYTDPQEQEVGDLLTHVEERLYERFAADDREELARCLATWPKVEHLLAYSAGSDGQTPAFTLFMEAVLQDTWEATRHAQSAQMQRLDPQQRAPWRAAWEAGVQLPIAALTPVALHERLAGWHGCDSAEPHHFLSSGLGGACVSVGGLHAHALMTRSLDASKRLLLLTNRSGEPQVRAMLRLMRDARGNPVLMLSRFYNSGGIADEAAKAAMLALAQARARALGLPLAGDSAAYGATPWDGGSLTSEAGAGSDYYDEGGLGVRLHAYVKEALLTQLA